MKTAKEMVEILERTLEFEYKTLFKYQKKYEETRKEIYEQMSMEKMEAIITLERLYKDFTGKNYIPKGKKYKGMTIRDAFIKEQSYIITLFLNGEYHLYIEALSKNGEAIQDEQFNENSLTQNLCAELINEDGDVVDNVELEMTYFIEFVEDIMKQTLNLLGR